MFIITQAEKLENCKDNNYLVQDTEIEKQFQKTGYHRYERTYKLKDQYNEYTIVCLEYRNDTIGFEPIVIIPDFLVPGRPYPVYI